jgi:peptidyl-prolyl cis-trans isomerase C
MKDAAKINIILLVLIFIVSCTICVLLLRNMRLADTAATGISAGWDAKKQLDFAETLASKGLKKEALGAFDDYLKIAKISAIESAKFLYRMGNMHMELLNYDKALYYFYKAEAADPNAGFKSELDNKLIACLENLGMATQAQYELTQRAVLGLKPEEKHTGGAVVAKVAGEEITEREIDDAINAMPEWARENFSQPEGKVEFVRQYATTQALYKKATMMGLDQDAEVRRNIKEMTKQVLVQKLLEKEIGDKLKADPSDIEMYYKANKEKYAQEATATASVIKFSNLSKAQDAMRRLAVGADFVKMAKELSEDEKTKAKDGLIEGNIEANGSIPGIGASKEATDAIFSKKEADTAGPFKINDAYYIFKINSLKPKAQRPFEEVKEQVEYEYRNNKAQEQMQILLKGVMQEEQVEIFPLEKQKEAETDEAKKEKPKD